MEMLYSQKLSFGVLNGFSEFRIPRFSDMEIPHSFNLKIKILNSFLQNLEVADSEIPVQGPTFLKAHL
jgi:hypothetical protein